MKRIRKKIFLDDAGAFLGRGEGCLIVRDKKRNVQKYPLFEDEIGEVQIKIGNSVSSGALATCAFWGIDVLILTHRGNPVAYLRGLDDDSHVKTRVCQYKALENEKGIEIAKNIVLSKIEGQNNLLKKHGLRQHDLIRAKQKIAGIKSEKLAAAKKTLMSLEGRFTDRYFKQIFPLLPTALLVDKRRTYKAYDGINNTFNLCYTVLKWRVQRAIIKAKLEPFLGFLHSEQFGMPSLACDLMELYRFLVDDFMIKYVSRLRKKDFVMKEDFSANGKRKGKRQYLNKPLTKDLMAKLNSYFETMVDIPRIRIGSRQKIETLFNEEALLLAKYLREEKKEWKPRIPSL